MDRQNGPPFPTEWVTTSLLVLGKSHTHLRRNRNLIRKNRISVLSFSQWSQLVHQMVKDFQQECVRIIAAASVPDSNEVLLMCSLPWRIRWINSISVMWNWTIWKPNLSTWNVSAKRTLSDLRFPLVMKRRSMRGRRILASSKLRCLWLLLRQEIVPLTGSTTPRLSLISTKTSVILFPPHTQSGTLLSTLRDVRDTKNEILEVRQQLVQAYHQDTLTRWNANDFAFSSVEPDLASSRPSTL